jgi:hypothetical protein
MKTSTFEKGIPMLPRACVLAFMVIATLSLAGCGFVGGLTDDNVPEGERCNPYTSHNECASGLVCAGYPPATPGAGWSGIVIPLCPENYCCAADSNGNITSSNPNCQPGCNGGALSMCNANMMLYADACAFAGVDTGAPAPSSEGDGDGGGD